MRFSSILAAAAAAATVFMAMPGIANATYVFGNSNGGDGYLVGSYPGFSIFGSDNGAQTNYASYTETVDATGNFTFDWSYNTYDCCGSYWDPAGYVIDGTYFQLSTDYNCNGSGTCTGTYDTSGVTTVSLTAGDTFGWYVYSPDSCCGRGEISVSAVPEPLTIGLFGAGLLGLGALRRRRKLSS